MNYEELVNNKKYIGDMSKEELFIYCQGLLEEVWAFEKENKKLNKTIDELTEKVLNLHLENTVLKTQIEDKNKYSYGYR